MLQELTGILAELLEVQKETGPALERLEELELSRAKWEAEMEAFILKADSSYRAASNAESRARTMVKRYEKENFDLGDADGDEEEARPRDTHSRNDVAGGEEEGMYPMHVGMETAKSAALRAKWGV